MAANGLNQEDIVAIRGVFDHALSDISAQRVEHWVSHWTQDAVLMAPDTNDVVGHQALQAWLQGRPAVIRFEVTACEIEGSGDLAVLVAHFVRVLADADGVETRQPGRQLVKFHRQPDGRWLIATAIFNADAG